jgi:hypothetical protein
VGQGNSWIKIKRQSTKGIRRWPGCIDQPADRSNGQAACGVSQPIPFPVPGKAFNDILPQTFNGVSIDNNSNYDSGIAGYHVMPGYDLAIGFGSPNADQFVNDLAALLPSK